VLRHAALNGANNIKAHTLGTDRKTLEEMLH